jgi:hypothetical protein
MLKESLSHAARIIPVVEGAIATIVIVFVAQVWHAVPPAKGHDAFVLIYASGAHFLFSFLFIVPGLLVSSRTRSVPLDTGLFAGLFAYVFWSLNEQHRELADLLIEPSWRIPLPMGEELSHLLETMSGGPDFRLFLSPLVLAWLVALLVAAVVGLVRIFLPKAKSSAES